MENNDQAKQDVENNTDTIFNAEEFSYQGYDKHIRQARNAMFFAAGLLLINVILLVASSTFSYDYLWLDMAIWGTFIASFVLLGFWTKKKPYTAIVCALILYVAFIVLNACIDISTIIQGWLFKIIIIVFLVKGINDAKEAQQRQKDQVIV